MLAALAALAWIAGTSRESRAEGCSPPLHPRIAEVFYDAVGDDTGHEFVELFNPFGVTLPLAGARLEAGDGSGPGRWTLRWTGGAADSVAPGRRFVVGGALIGVTPQALVTLDLQNGPDAVRMVWPDGTVEVVGYGALEVPEYACGAPAADVASGQSLVRIPDDADGGSNAIDFRAGPPTPGVANQKRRDLAWAQGASRLASSFVALGEAVGLDAALENRGSETLAPSDCGWSVRESGTTLGGGVASRALAAGETTGVGIQLRGLAAGKRTLVLVAALPGDEGPENDLDSLSVRIGPGPLQLTEIQFHPAAGEGEWVEVVNATESPLDLSRYGFADRGEHPGHAGQALLEPESLAVMAQDRAALLARYPKLDTTRVLRVSPWPALNNADDASGVADVAMLIDAEGTPSDRVPYSAAGVPAGVPLERRDGLWAASSMSGGTPLEPPAAMRTVLGRFEVEPRRLLAGAEARLRWDLPWPRARIACELYDLAGRPRGRIFSDLEVAARGERRWTPQQLTPGLYLMVLEARPNDGDAGVALTRPIRLEAP
jgi:hypothetical protein